MRAKHIAQRSCVVCKAKTDKRDLIRLVMADGGLLVDPSGKRNGRGAYLCKSKDCWNDASAHRQLSRALRQSLSDGDRAYLRQMTPS